MPESENETVDLIQEKLAALPDALRQAIYDADMESHLRRLSEKHKLHVDQWVTLEQQIMLTLLGIEEPGSMVSNIQREVHVSTEAARAIVNDIVQEVFQPIREQMQRELKANNRDTQDASTPTENGADTHKQRPTDTLAYRSGESSLERRDVQDDPYRESIE